MISVILTWYSSNMLELDRIDQHLLSLLRSDSRASTSALARELGVSRSTVQDRIHRLQRRKVIAGFTVREHPDFQGRQLQAHVMIEVNPKRSAAIVDALASMAGVRTLQTVSGIYDMVTMVEAPTTEAMDTVLDEIGQLEGVEKTTTSIVLTTKFKH